jgi:hypothetical protein
MPSHSSSKQASFGEAGDQLAATHQPDVPAAGRCDHLRVHLCDVGTGEAQVGIGNGRKVAGREDPGGRRGVRPCAVAEDELVRPGSHGNRADVGEEPLVVLAEPFDVVNCSSQSSRSSGSAMKPSMLDAT